MAQDKKKKLTAPAPDARHLSLEETDEIVDFYMFNAFRIAMGTMFCIVSPVVAVLIDGFNTASLIPEEAAELLESMSIIIFVAIAACMFIYSGVRMEKWSFLHEEACILDSRAARFVRREKSGYWPMHMKVTAAGVALCAGGIVLGVLVSRLGEEQTVYAFNLGAALLLILLSIGVFLIVMSMLRMHYYNMLLGLKGKKPRKKEQQPEDGRVKYKIPVIQKGMSVFWPTVLAFYLSMSFLTFAWEISWIIWPIAFIAMGIINLLFKER